MKMIQLLYTVLFVIAFKISLVAQEGDYMGSRVEVSYSTTYQSPVLCEYDDFFIDGNSEIKDDELKELFSKYTQNEFFVNGNKLKIVNKYSLTWMAENHFYITFYEVNKDGLQKPEYYISHDQKNSQESFITILNLRPDAFWQFYNKQDNPKYPIINRLKENARLSNGAISVSKLAKLIDDNKILLSRYLLK